MIDDNEYQLNIYKIDTKVKIDKKRVIIVILIILSFICIILTGNYISKITKGYKVYKQYEAQLNSIKHQEEEKQAKIKEETEKKKKERNPQLTDIRKTKYGYYL